MRNEDLSITNPSYVIRFRSKKGIESHIWDSSSPIALGYPFHSLVEKTDKGIRVRRIDLVENEIEPVKALLITSEMIKKSEAVEMPSHGNSKASDSYTLEVREISKIPPVLESRSSKVSKADAVAIYFCVKDNILESERFNDAYTGKMFKTKVFELKHRNKTYTVRVEQDGVSAKGKTLKIGDTIEMTLDELVENPITYGNFKWVFDATGWEGTIEERTQLDPEIQEFKKSLLYSTLAIAGAIILASIGSYFKLGGSAQEELIPEQFTKLVMTPTVHKDAGPAASSPEVKAGQTPSQAKAEKTAIAQAFRAKALQNSISGLLKGGMTRLLVDADFVAGKDATTQSSRIFDTKNSIVNDAKTDVGKMDNPHATVASVGGEGGSGAPGQAKGVGYRSGGHAQVNGQGRSLIKIDAVDSTVQEGLTKEEVGEVIHKHLSEIRYCYEAAILRVPDIEGKLVVSFTIGANGQVSSSEVKSSTLSDARLDDCILRRLGSWKFPKTKGGTAVAVTYPFIFKTLGK